ncbi:MAG TPA: copper-binding protein [Noviherbaspirillum sp.]
MRHITAITCLAAALSLSPFALAASDQPGAAAAAALSDGEIRKVDKSAGKITIKHGPIANLEMPNMTMVFRAKDPAMLEQVKAGDKVKFAAEKVNGVFTVTQIEPVK